MATARRQRFLFGQAAWMLGSLVVLALLSSLSLDLFFVLSLVGFLVLVELTAAFNLTLKWRSRLKWVILVGLAGFGYVVVQRILAAIPS